MEKPYGQYDPTWLWYDTCDFAPFDQQVNDVIGLCPEAKILCLIDLNSPLWLTRQLYVDSYPAVTLAAPHDRWIIEVNGTSFEYEFEEPDTALFLLE